MVRVAAWWCVVLWWMLYGDVRGIIEIVEELHCHDLRLRLTCRDLQTHIAILEAWYSTTEEYHLNHTASNLMNPNETSNNSLPFPNDSELNRVYFYSSPKHNGFYEPMNHSIFENVTQWPALLNDTKRTFVDDTLLNDTVDVSGEVMNSEGCGVTGFTRSYASWRGDRGRRIVAPESAVNLRVPVSYRCTGINHCSFILSDDYPAADSWLPGVVFIKYACFDDALSIHLCNRDVTIDASGPESEGYIRTPGYPNYYIGGACAWRLTAAPEQQIRVTLLDLSLRSVGPFEKECTDYLLIRDSNGDTLLSSCDQVELPLQLTSSTNNIEILVQAGSQGAFPKRGILIHYKSINCVTLPAPSNGYLVYRNAELAHYMCSVNRVFVDTRERARVIWCYDENRWNDSVPFCIEETTVNAVDHGSEQSTGRETKLPHNEPNMLVDIVIPSLLIAALFIGNAFIVLIIYKYRKRQKMSEASNIFAYENSNSTIYEDITPDVPCKDLTDPNKNKVSTRMKNNIKCDCEDEFNTIPLSVNGNANSAGNAV